MKFALFLAPLKALRARWLAPAKRFVWAEISNPGALVAVHAILSTQKRTLAAATRCNRRRSRALERLEADPPYPIIFPQLGVELTPEEEAAVRPEATAWIRSGCQLCGLCAAYGLPPAAARRRIEPWSF